MIPCLVFDFGKVHLQTDYYCTVFKDKLTNRDPRKPPKPETITRLLLKSNATII